MLKSFLDPKALYREQAKNIRAEFAGKHPYAARHAAANFLTHLAPEKDKTVAVYFPTGSEMDTKPLVDGLQETGCTIALPVVVKKDSSLIFRQYTVGDQLIEGAYGIFCPPDTAKIVIPDIIVCPLLAFKRNGTRLGMGGGYYDRTLSALRKKRHILAVGYAFACQEMSKFPAEKHDEPLDWIVTEQSAFQAG
jgi:5-formyltetrahydrofolate cyclo-ligase